MAIDADAGAGISEVMSEAEQLDLLGMRPPPANTQRGRPPGRINKRTEAVSTYLLARYSDPLEGLVAMASLGVEALAASLGCTRLEAWEQKRHCAVAALPYLHQRQAVALDLTQRQAVYLSILDQASGQQAANEDAGDIAGQIVNILENQDDSSGGPDAV